jgi:membrane protein DedA with SNARE-associated domain
VVASAVGAWGTYFIARWGGRALVDRFQNYLGFTWADIESVGAHFTKRGEEISLFALRAVPIVPLSLISAAAGILEIPFRIFIVWTVLGTIPAVTCWPFWGGKWAAAL